MANGSLQAAVRAAALITITLAAGLSACTNGTQSNPNLAVAERFIDAFYSYSPNALSISLAKAPTDANRTLYYQAWAEAGDYQIQERRPCEMTSSTQAQCAVKVTDNIGGTLGYVATDTFILEFAQQNLVGVRFTSDDPPIFEELQRWLQTHRPEVFTGPCKDMFAGGTTPGACVRAVVRGAKDFVQGAP